MDDSGILTLLGSGGFYQILLYFCLWVCQSVVSINHLIMSIFGYTPPHRCYVPNGYLLNNSLPTMNTTGVISYSKCKAFRNFNASSGIIETCPNGWIFEVIGRQSSIVTEWSLVCDEKYLLSTATTVYFTGVLVGCIIFGQLSDIFGRKIVLLSCLYSYIAFSTAIFFVKSYQGFIVLRFFIGALIQGIQTTSYVLLVELTVAKSRSLVAGIFEPFWSVGTIWMASLAWLIRDWRYIQLAICLPSLISLVYIYLVPESIRWLLGKGEKEKAEYYVRRMASFKRVSLPKAIDWETPEKDGTKKENNHSIADLFKTKEIRKRTLLMSYLWFASCCCFYGISLGITEIYGDIYINIFSSTIVEAIANMISLLFFVKLNRRLPQMFLFFAGGLSCILVGVLNGKSGGNGVLILTFVLVGKFFMTCCQAMNYLLSVELFPTVIRSLAVGFCLIWGRVSGIIVPYVLLLGAHTFKGLPFLIFGTIGIIAVGFTWLLPETRGTTLPNTIEEVENGTEMIVIRKDIGRQNPSFAANEEVNTSNEFSDGNQQGAPAVSL